MKIRELFKLGKLLGKKEEPEKKKSMIMEIVEEPDKFRLEAEIDNGELIIKIKKKEVSE